MALARRLVLGGAGALLCAVVLAPVRLAQVVHTLGPDRSVRFEIPAGTGGRETARILAGAGVFRDEAQAVGALRLWGDPRMVKAGAYRMDGRFRPADVLEAVTAGRVEQRSVTLPEGLTGAEIAVRLGEAGVTGADAFQALVYDPASPARWGVPGPSLEGFLYPDTYRFAAGVPPERVVDTLVDRFRQVVESLPHDANPRASKLLSWVTLASIVEKETGAPGERPRVAAVFLNRLDRGMRLESDPTVIYGLTSFDGNLRRTDLEADTLYNTYTRKGLPPGPIANPGRDSLAAVLHPARTDALYFVSRNDGTHVFSRTYEEHRRAVNRFQRRGRR